MDFKAFVIFAAILCSIVVADDPKRDASSSSLEIPNFDQFKIIFHKHYASLSEELQRRRLFMARAFREFVSKARYQLGLQSYFLRVNDMSDYTPDELQKVYNADQPIKDLPIESTVDQTTQNQKTWGWSDYFQKAKSAVSSWIYPAEKKEPQVASSSSGSEDATTELQIAKTIDLRETGCFLEPKSQHQCGSCYSFAAISMLEFSYCKQTGKLASFSEQYIVDCGKEFGAKGCSGVPPEKFDTMISGFVRKYGVEYRSHYSYVAENQTCPYGPDVEVSQIGPLRADDFDLEAIDLKNFDQHLERSPILAVVAIYPYFHEYGGGVDNCEGQGPDVVATPHAMLIIGAGQEDGQEYYLIRNSHGIKWGVDGLFKLSKSSPCLFQAKGWIPKSLLESKPTFTVNKNYKGDEVKRRLLEKIRQDIAVLGSEPPFPEQTIDSLLSKAGKISI